MASSNLLDQQILDTFDFLTIRGHACRQVVQQHTLGEDELFTDFAPRFQQWNDNHCLTCFEDYQAGDIVSELQCGHYQHTHCFLNDNFHRNDLRCAECRAHYLNPWLEHAVLTESEEWTRLAPIYQEGLWSEDRMINIEVYVHFAVQVLLALVEDVTDAEQQRDALILGAAKVMNLFRWLSMQSRQEQHRLVPTVDEMIKHLVKRAIFGQAQQELKPGEPIMSPVQCEAIVDNALAEEPWLASDEPDGVPELWIMLWHAVERRPRADEGYASEG